MVYKFICIITALLTLSACGKDDSHSAKGRGKLNLIDNEIQVEVKAWDGNVGKPNQAFVDVEVCQVQSTNCQTIKNILLDTGSVGLRLFKSSLSVALNPVSLNSSPVVECVHFLKNYAWGGLYRADIKLGGYKAVDIPIQLIDVGHKKIPSSCASLAGRPLQNPEDLGANGILGVGAKTHDCPTCASQAEIAHYYSCANTPCTPVVAPLSVQVANPISMLPMHNNGIVIDLPAANSSSQKIILGKMILGINTAENNKLMMEDVFFLDANGFITTIYEGNIYNDSLFDTGSNAIYFPDKSIATCSLSRSFYCPVSPLAKSALIISGQIRQTVDFKVLNADLMPRGEAVLPNLTGAKPVFIWGLPFFYGRKVFLSIGGNSLRGQTKPMIAF
jgi:hypothetical protein